MSELGAKEPYLAVIPRATPNPYFWYNVALWTYAIAFYIVLYTPLVLIVVLSANASEITGFPFSGFTVHWYEVAFSSAKFMRALWNSFAIGTITSIVATTIAMMLVLAFRHDFRGKGLIMNLVMVPIIVPGIVSGIVLLLFFGYLGVPSSLYTTVLVGHINWVLPFAFLTLYPRLHNFDHTLEEAAMDLGATAREIFWHIVFPIVRPGIAATMLFAFSLSFDEFIRTLFLTGTEATIPVRFWGMIVDTVAPELPAMAVIMMVITVAASMLGFKYANSRAPRAHAVRN